MQINFYLDDNNNKRAVIEPPFEIIGWFLEQDIQTDIEFCNELIHIIDDVKKGKREKWECRGNIHSLLLTEQKTFIENEYAIPQAKCEVSLDDLRYVIVNWKEFLTNSKKHIN